MPEWMRLGGTYGARICYAPADDAAGGGTAGAGAAGGGGDSGVAVGAAGVGGAGPADGAASVGASGVRAGDGGDSSGRAGGAGDDTGGAAGAGTVADDKAAATADFPEDWRERLAGGDDKLLSKLKRYQSPGAFAKAGHAAQQKIAEGAAKSPLPKDATPEQVAAWRAENGIPEKPEGYLEKLPDGLVIGDADKPLVGKFVEAMHGKNVAPDVVQAALGAWRDIRQQQIDAILGKDEADRSAADEALRGEWGPDFKRNNAAIEGVLVQYGSPEMAKGLLDARMPDGTLLRNSPDAMRLLAGLATEINPAHTVVPGAGANAGRTIDEEIAGIEKVMRTDRKAYNADTAMQGRYLKLIEAKQKIASRAA